MGIGHVVQDAGGFDDVKAPFHPPRIQDVALNEVHAPRVELRGHAARVGEGAAAQVETQYPASRAPRGDGDGLLAGAAARRQNLDGVGRGTPAARSEGKRLAR